MDPKKKNATLALAFAGTGIGLLFGVLLFGKKASSAIAPTTTGLPSWLRPTPTPARPTSVPTPIVPLQDPRVSALSDSDPVKLRLVSDVLSVQLDALQAAQQPSVMIRATAYLVARGTAVPVLTFHNPNDALWWAARKINELVMTRFYPQVSAVT